MKCKHCDSEIPNDSVFCEHCGNTVTQKKQIVTCDISLVKWLLYGMMFVLCASNLLVPIHFDGSDNIDSVVFLWWIIPLLSLIICIISLVLTIKKKLSAVFTIVLFLLFSANTIEMAVGIGGLWERDYYTLGGTVYSQGYGSYELKPAYASWRCPRYDSREEASQAIGQMGFSRTLSSRKTNLDNAKLSRNAIETLEIGPIRMSELVTNGVEEIVVILTILEGSILVLYLISNVIHGLIVARKEHDRT